LDNASHSGGGAPVRLRPVRPATEDHRTGEQKRRQLRRADTACLITHPQPPEKVGGAAECSRSAMSATFFDR